MSILEIILMLDSAEKDLFFGLLENKGYTLENALISTLQAIQVFNPEKANNIREKVLAKGVEE